MALVQLVDSVIPEVYLDYMMDVDDLQKSQFVQSGILVRNAILDAEMRQGGREGYIPFWNDLDPTDEPNYSDDTENNATPAKITAGKQRYRKAFLNYALKDADLVAELAGSDPMNRIRQRFSAWWMKQLQRRLIESCKGIMADNIANDGSDMVNDIGAATVGAVTVANNMFHKNAFIDTVMTMGDRFDETSVIMMHSMVYANLLKVDEAEDVRDSEGRLLYRSYMGHRVIIEDNPALITAASGSGSGDTPIEYTSIIFGQGAFAYGQNLPRVPIAVQREELQGNGGGTEVIVERQNWLLHPLGFQFLSADITGESPDWSELRAAAEWDRVVDRQHVPLAFLISNG